MTAASVEGCLSVYKCLCDVTRLRILNLLKEKPLCVCHFQDILGEPQSKMSKQLTYMKRHRMVESVRQNNWTIYRLPQGPNPLLEENLRCLQDVVFQGQIFRDDLSRMDAIDTSAACLPAMPKCFCT